MSVVRDLVVDETKEMGTPRAGMKGMPSLGRFASSSNKSSGVKPRRGSSVEVDLADDEVAPSPWAYKMLSHTKQDSFAVSKKTMGASVKGPGSFEMARRTSFGSMPDQMSFQTCQSIRGPDLSRMGKASSCMGLSFQEGPTPTFSSQANQKVFGWSELTVKVKSKAGAELQLLSGVSGTARSGDLVALVGPSGAGKSTLLDVLSFRKTVGNITGQINFNDTPMTQRQLQPISSYATQEDTFHPTQTVLEAVMFQAMMRLAGSIPYNKKLYMAREIIALAGLDGKEDHAIGGALPGGLLVRGLSGGEKRRLGLCCATITSPDVLFADEPTSGLDSLAALMIMKLLRGFSDTGMIIFCTIHQPRQAIWSLFDKVMVLAKGNQLFYGSPKSAERWFTEGLRCNCPPNTSPSDFIMDQANIDFDKSSIYGTQTLDTVDDLKEMASNFRKAHPEIFKGSSLLSTSSSSQLQAPGKLIHPPYDRSKKPDFVFLVHSIMVDSILQFLFPKKDAETPYINPWWAPPLYPLFTVLYAIAGPLVNLCQPWIKPYIVLDSWDFYPEGADTPTHVQTWSTCFMALQYLPGSCYIKSIKEAINHVARSAMKQGIPYLGLGAFNKAEWINHGGEDIIKDVQPESTHIVHGNTMTAAAVVANVLQLVGAKHLPKEVFLTGSTSKCGVAVALYLAHKGFTVHCYTQSEKRFNEFSAKLSPEAAGRLVRSADFADGTRIKLWIVGKWQREINDFMGEKCEALVFAVPDPVDQSKRPDVNVTDGALFQMHPSSYTVRRNAIQLTSPYLYACYTGALVHSTMKWDRHEKGYVDWEKLDDHLAAAYKLRLRLPSVDRDPKCVNRSSWTREFLTLLKRNFRSYTRNLGNVAARTGIALGIAVVVGLVYHNAGKKKDLSVMNDIFGSLFYNLFVLCLLPFACQSGFLYDRQFFQREAAAGIYPTSAYYAANVLLEMVFNTVNAILYSAISYPLINYQAFVRAADPFQAFGGYLGIMVLMNLTANAMVLFFCLLSPNQEVAFVTAAAYIAIASVSAGLYVTEPHMWAPIRWIEWTSMIKYPYQAMLLHFFKDNKMIKPWLHQNKLDVVGTVEANVGITAGIYGIFILGGYLALNYLHKERR